MKVQTEVQTQLFTQHNVSGLLKNAQRVDVEPPFIRAMVQHAALVTLKGAQRNFILKLVNRASQLQLFKVSEGYVVHLPEYRTYILLEKEDDVDRVLRARERILHSPYGDALLEYAPSKFIELAVHMLTRGAGLYVGCNQTACYALLARRENGMTVVAITSLPVDVANGNKQVADLVEALMHVSLLPVDTVNLNGFPASESRTLAEVTGALTNRKVTISETFCGRLYTIRADSFDMHAFVKGSTNLGCGTLIVSGNTVCLDDRTLKCYMPTHAFDPKSHALVAKALGRVEVKKCKVDVRRCRVVHKERVSYYDCTTLADCLGKHWL